MSGAVLYDGWCGEPIAWARVGDPVIGQEWTEHGSVAVTGRLSPAEALRKYGSITEMVNAYASAQVITRASGRCASSACAASSSACA